MPMLRVSRGTLRAESTIHPCLFRSVLGCFGQIFLGGFGHFVVAWAAGSPGMLLSIAVTLAISAKIGDRSQVPKKASRTRPPGTCTEHRGAGRQRLQTEPQAPEAQVNCASCHDMPEAKGVSDQL